MGNWRRAGVDVVVTCWHLVAGVTHYAIQTVEGGMGCLVRLDKSKDKCRRKLRTLHILFNVLIRPGFGFERWRVSACLAVELATMRVMT